RPSIVLVGSHAGDFARVQIAEGTTILLEGALDGSRLRWPASNAPLGPNQQYAVTLIPRAPGAASATVTVFVGSEDEEVPVVLTVDCRPRSGARLMRRLSRYRLLTVIATSAIAALAAGL